ncbi:hypothetical protein, partial [Marinilabilia salmonicolor]|uniref:hypothetical protein n=1 Tax=Marinilabilia salmonicolor TaxID=989 RepID=UPI001C69BACB
CLNVVNVILIFCHQSNGWRPEDAICRRPMAYKAQYIDNFVGLVKNGLSRFGTHIPIRLSSEFITNPIPDFRSFNIPFIGTGHCFFITNLINSVERFYGDLCVTLIP